MNNLTVEERIKLMIGELTVSNLLLQAQVAALQRQLAEALGPHEVKQEASAG